MLLSGDTIWYVFTVLCSKQCTVLFIQKFNLSLMATNKQHFLTKSADIRNQINSEFDNLIERVNTRRNELLTKLDDAVSRYQRLVRESACSLSLTSLISTTGTTKTTIKSNS